MTADDLDSGVNSKITYSLERGDRHQQFSVDPNTGHIIVVRPLDREMVNLFEINKSFHFSLQFYSFNVLKMYLMCFQIPSYSLQVKATDGGSPEMSSFALVSIEVLDVNDNPPLFLLPNYTCVVQVLFFVQYFRTRKIHRKICII